MADGTILSLVLYLPLAGMLAIAALPAGRDGAVRALTLGVMVVQFLLSLVLYAHFDPAVPGLQAATRVRPNSTRQLPSAKSRTLVARWTGRSASGRRPSMRVVITLLRSGVRARCPRVTVRPPGVPRKATGRSKPG